MLFLCDASIFTDTHNLVNDTNYVICIRTFVWGYWQQKCSYISHRKLDRIKDNNSFYAIDCWPAFVFFRRTKKIIKMSHLWIKKLIEQLLHSLDGEFEVNSRDSFRLTHLFWEFLVLIFCHRKYRWSTWMRQCKPFWYSIRFNLPKSNWKRTN